MLRDAVPPRCFDNVLIQPFMPDRSVISRRIRILLRLTRLDFLDWDVVFFSPLQKLVTDIVGSVIIPFAFQSPPPLDERV